MRGLFAVSALVATTAAPVDLVTGANFLQAGAVHPASGDVLVLTNPGDQASQPVSVAVIPAGSKPGQAWKSLTAIANGTQVAYPSDVAFGGSRAFVVDQGTDGVASLERGASGAWSVGKTWLLRDLLPACDDQGRHYVELEAIAAGPKGELYVSTSVIYGQRCLLHPLDKCCKGVTKSSAVMSFDPDAGTLTEVIASKSFFNFESEGKKDASFHIRSIDVTADGDVVMAGYGDTGSYFGHSAWRWEKKTQQVQRIAGQDWGQEGKPGEGDGGEAVKSKLNLPWGIVAANEDVYISEAGNSDVRRISHGVISSAEGAPTGKDKLPNSFFRKIHRGASPGRLLLAVSGLGENEGHLVEFDIPPTGAAVLV